MNAMPERNADAFAKFRADTNARLASGEIINVTGLGGYCILAAGSVIEECGPHHMAVRAPSGNLRIYKRRP